MVAQVALTMLLGLGLTAEEAKWEQKARSDGVTVWSRAREGTDVKELKAIGLVEAPPKVVMRILADYVRYREIMPYTDESKVVATEEGGRVVHFYSLVNAPFVSKRDYTLRIVDESDWKDGKGYLKTRWSVSEKGPAPREDTVRVKTNDGSWTLEAIDGGTRTRATYWLFTDPGGSLPTWVINKANSSAIPDVFAALREHSRDEKYAEK